LFIKKEDKNMEKLSYKNVASIIIFFLLPWFYFENMGADSPKIYTSLLYVVVSIGVAYLLYENIKSIKNTKGKKRIVPIIFLFFPAFIILLAVYAKFFLFFNYKGL